MVLEKNCKEVVMKNYKKSGISAMAMMLFAASFLVILILGACDNEPDSTPPYTPPETPPPVSDYEEVTITDSRLVGTWRHTYKTDYYGSGSYGEQGIDYYLVISDGGAYTYTGIKFKRYGGNYYNEGEVGTSIDMSKIELYKTGSNVRIGAWIYYKELF